VSEAVVRLSVTVAGRPEMVRAAREFVARVLGPAHPRVSVAALLASELVTNSVRHSASGLPAVR